MNQQAQLRYYPLTRQEALFIHLRRHESSFNEIGRKLGITASAARKLCNNETVPSRRYAQLLDIGIPQELLPKPYDFLSGEKRKHIASSSSTNLVLEGKSHDATASSTTHSARH